MNAHYGLFNDISFVFPTSQSLVGNLNVDKLERYTGHLVLSTMAIKKMSVSMSTLSEYVKLQFNGTFSYNWEI